MDIIGDRTGFITIRNYITLKRPAKDGSGRDGFITIRNYITLKLVMKGSF